MNGWKQWITDRLRRHRTPLICCAIAALGALAYANSLYNAFEFDDVDGIVRSPILRDLRNLPSYFTDIRSSVVAGGHDWRPVVLATLALNYAIDGLNPAVFRLTNLAIHVGVACLIFLFLIELFHRRPELLPRGATLSAEAAAASAAALFVVHPVNSEMVNHIWARSSGLAALFYLLSFYCFIRGPWNFGNASKSSWGVAGIVFFAVGLGAKATVITLPAALLLYEILFAPANPFWRDVRKLRKYLPLAAISAAYVLFRFVYLRGFFRRVGGGSSDDPAAAYLLTQFRAWIYYIRLFFWPSPLIADYPGFGWSRSLAEPRVLIALVVIAAVLALAWGARRANPLLSFFILWFFLLLLPEASFIPLFDAVNGYRAYPAYIGLAIVALLFSLKMAAWLRGKIGHRLGDSLRPAYGSVAVLVICGLTAGTMARNRDWKDGLTLWSDVVRKDPTNGRAYTNLAVEFLHAGEYQKAEEYLQQAIALDPVKGLPYMYRGYVSLAVGRGDLGLGDFTKAIELSRRVPIPFYYRGEVYRKSGDYDKALADYEAALALMPFYTDALMGTALVHMDKHENDQATAACAKITEIDPTDARGYNCLGILFLEQNRIADAIRIYQRGVIHVPRNGGLWYGLGLAYEQSRMFKEAADAFDIAGRLRQ